MNFLHKKKESIKEIEDKVLEASVLLAKTTRESAELLSKTTKESENRVSKISEVSVRQIKILTIVLIFVGIAQMMISIFGVCSDSAHWTEMPIAGADAALCSTDIRTS